MKDCGVRIAVLSDAVELVRLMKQLGYEIGLAAMKENIRYYLEHPEYFAWVAEGEKGKVLGSISGVVIRTFHCDASDVKILSVVVDEDARGQGIGKRMIGAVEGYALQRGCRLVELTSNVKRVKDGTHAFYEGLGYGERG